MFKTVNINKEKVIYIACFLTPASVSLLQKQYGKIINDIHMTLTYYGKKECDFPIDLIGTKVTLTVDGEGEYEENREIKNIGLHVDETSLCQVLPDGSHLFSQFTGSVPHITVRVENGGKPVDTAKCEWRPITPFTVEALTTPHD